MINYDKDANRFTIEVTPDELRALDINAIIAEYITPVDIRALRIEYLQGSETHSSSWAKFYIKGLEEIVVKEEHDSNLSDRHHGYQYYYGNLKGEESNLFTIFSQDGDKRGTANFEFYICQLDAYSFNRIEGKYGFCEGNFSIIASAIGKTKAPRLMGWWVDNKHLQSPEYARCCGESINKRGQKYPLGYTNLHGQK
jgi:hypothetical protein